MTKIEDATNEQLNVAVAEKVMEWHVGPPNAWMTKDGERTGWSRPDMYRSADRWWQPTTKIENAFQVDKPEWAVEHWEFMTLEGSQLCVRITKDWAGSNVQTLVCVPILDPNNKAAAYCRGRVLCALKACGVEEL